MLTSIWTFWPVRRMKLPLALDAHDALGAAMAERYGRRHPFTLLVRAWERRVARRVDHIFVCSSVDRDYFMQRIRRGGGARDGGSERRARPAARRKMARRVSWPAGWAERLAGRTVLFFMGKPALPAERPGAAFLERGGPAGTGAASGPAGSASSPAAATRRPACRIPRCILRGWSPMRTCSVFLRRRRHLPVADFHRVRHAPEKPGIHGRREAGGFDTRRGRRAWRPWPAGTWSSPGPETFTQAILELCDAPDRARAMGLAGYRFVRERYDWRQSIQPLWRERLQILTGGA